MENIAGFICGLADASGIGASGHIWATVTPTAVHQRSRMMLPDLLPLPIPKMMPPKKICPLRPGKAAADKASNVFQREFDVPPTVTLKSGTEMGVLILSVGKAENGVNEAIQTQQNAVQQREGQPVYNSRPLTQQQQNRTYPY